MKTFTDEDIKALAKDKRISGKDYLSLMLAVKQGVEAAVPEPQQADIMSGIREALLKIADKIEPRGNESLTPVAPVVTVNLPARGNWTATVTERDRDGYIKRVSFKEVMP